MVFDGFGGSSLFQPSNLQMATTDLGPVPYKGLNGSAEKISSGQRNLIKAIYNEAYHNDCIEIFLDQLGKNTICLHSKSIFYVINHLIFFSFH